MLTNCRDALKHTVEKSSLSAVLTLSFVLSPSSWAKTSIYTKLYLSENHHMHKKIFILLSRVLAGHKNFWVLRFANHACPWPGNFFFSQEVVKFEIKSENWNPKIVTSFFFESILYGEFYRAVRSLLDFSLATKCTKYASKVRKYGQ